MTRCFIAPSRYVQGPGALDLLGELIAPRHQRAAVLIDTFLTDQLGSQVLASLSRSGVKAAVTPTAGEVTKARINELAHALLPSGATVVVAIGGGKTLDTGKGVAHALGLRVVTAPTIASNDGPTSRVIALYDQAHRLIDTPHMQDNPEAVVVDTMLISQAPSHFLLSGIGDALAKKFETAACERGTGVASNGFRPLALARVIADGCYATLVRDGADAVASLGGHEVSPSLERVVEAIVLMSGLAFENGGLSLAHAMTRGLMAVPGAAEQPHGYHVAYGLVVQLVHEGDRRAYEEVVALLGRVGLPRSLRELGVVNLTASVQTIVEATLGAPHMANCVPVPTEKSLVAAITAHEGGLAFQATRSDAVTSA